MANGKIEDKTHFFMGRCCCNCINQIKVKSKCDCKVSAVYGYSTPMPFRKHGMCEFHDFKPTQITDKYVLLRESK